MVRFGTLFRLGGRVPDWSPMGQFSQDENLVKRTVYYGVFKYFLLYKAAKIAFFKWISQKHYFFWHIDRFLCLINIYFMTISFSGFLLSQSMLDLTFLPSRKNHGTFRIKFRTKVVCFCDKDPKSLEENRFLIISFIII